MINFYTYLTSYKNKQEYISVHISMYILLYEIVRVTWAINFTIANCDFNRNVLILAMARAIFDNMRFPIFICTYTYKYSQDTYKLTYGAYI